MNLAGPRLLGVPLGQRLTGPEFRARAMRPMTITMSDVGCRAGGPYLSLRSLPPFVCRTCSVGAAMRSERQRSRDDLHDDLDYMD